MADDFVAPAQVRSAIDLKLHRREGGNPGDAAVAHLRELIRRDEEAVLDRAHAAFDAISDAVGARGVGESLPVVFSRGGDELTDLRGTHLRRRGHFAGLKIDDAGGDELDAVGAIANASGDAVGGSRVVLDRLAHERAVTPAVIDRGAGAVNEGGVREFSELRFGFGRQRESDTVLIARVADGADAALEDLGPTGAGALQDPVRRLLQVGVPLIEGDRRAVEKQVRVRLDEAGKDSEIGQNGVGLALAFDAGAHGADFAGVEDQIDVAAHFV